MTVLFPAVASRARSNSSRSASRSVGTPSPRPSRIRSPARRFTLRQAFDSFIETHAKFHKKTWHEDVRRFEAHFTAKPRPRRTRRGRAGRQGVAWEHRKLSSITKGDVATWYAGLADTPHEANSAAALLHTIYEHAIDHDYTGPNPVRIRRASRFKERSRDRRLERKKIRAFFDALDDSPKKDFFLMLLFTGVRRRQAEGARWEDIDLEERTWRLEDTKGGKPLTVPLTAEAVEVLLRRRAAVPAECPWVFPSPREGKHLSDPTKAWQAICAAAGITDRLRLHDLRRTLATFMEEASVSATMIGKMLGPAVAGVTGVYTRAVGDPIRQATAKGIDEMLQAAGRRAPAREARKA